jgi:hypothetical protein
MDCSGICPRIVVARANSFPISKHPAGAPLLRRYPPVY